MINISLKSDDIQSISIAVFIAMIILCIGLTLLLKFIKAFENSKPEVNKIGRILEKPISNGNIEWYSIEFEDGTRTRLRNMNATTMIISVGDTGMITYKGKTIISFNRGQ